MKPVNCLSVLTCAFLIMAAGVVLAQPAPTTQNTDAGKVPPEVDQAMQLPKGDAQTKALAAALQDWGRKDPTAALVWAFKLPAPTSGQVVNVLLPVCATSNGKITADWLVKQNTRATLGNMHGTMYVWSRSDAAAAAAWCMTAPKNVRLCAFFSVGDGWYTKDAKAAADWAVKLESADDRLAAIRGVALKWGRSNIPAVTTWIKTLKPDEIKLAAKTIVGDSHANKLNPGGAAGDAAIKAWVEQLSLSDADKDDVLKGPPLPDITPQVTK